jgi:hypothetical protein
MKTTFISVLLCMSFCLQAQFQSLNNSKGFSSYFQERAKGTFSGYAEGLLQFEYKDGSKILASFSKDSAQLDIIPDPYTVYDVSSKNYIVESNGVEIKYSTYHHANAFIINTIKGLNGFTLFDGWSMDVIAGLDYEYIQKDHEELLILHFSEKVALVSICTLNSIVAYGMTTSSPEVYVLKGSTLIFHIRK